VNAIISGGRYERPSITRFGTFREITRQGFGVVDDGGFIIGDDGSTAPAGNDLGVGGSR
jgi:hypothetical protein